MSGNYMACLAGPRRYSLGHAGVGQVDDHINDDPEYARNKNSCPSVDTEYGTDYQPTRKENDQP